MKKEIYILIGLVMIFSFTLVFPARAALSSVTVTPSNYCGGYTSGYTIGFTTASTTPANGKIRLTFPAAFGTTNAATSTTLTGFDGIISTLSVMVLQRADGTDHTGGAVTVGIDNIVNPVNGGSFTVVVETLGGAGDVFEIGTSAVFTLFGGRQQPYLYNTDVLPPTSNITSPTEDATISAGKPYVIKGIGSDESTVQKVEVSLDGGKTWLVAQSRSVQGSFDWEYVWQNPTEGKYIIKVRATDAVGNIESPSAGVKVTVSAAVPPTVSPEKPITEMTAQELKVKIIELQEKVIVLLGQLIQFLQGTLVR